MFIYYEHLGIGASSLTDLVLSSDGRTTKIDFKNTQELSQSELIRALLKAIPPGEREYDASTHIWTFLGLAGTKVVNILNQAIQGMLLRYSALTQLTGLKNLVSKGNLAWKPYVPPAYNHGTWGYTPEKKYDEKDFFYSPPAAKSAISGDMLYSKLSSLMNISPDQLSSSTSPELKKLYRSACIRLHPDKGGDPMKMSELTMLWGIFNAS